MPRSDKMIPHGVMAVMATVAAGLCAEADRFFLAMSFAAIAGGFVIAIHAIWTE